METPARALGQVMAVDQDNVQTRRAASQATPTPVALPPITSTSVVDIDHGVGVPPLHIRWCRLDAD